MPLRGVGIFGTTIIDGIVGAGTRECIGDRGRVVSIKGISGLDTMVDRGTARVGTGGCLRTGR